MERKFESELGKRIQEGKKRDSTINFGIISAAVVSIALLVGSAVFLLPALAETDVDTPVQLNKPEMLEYLAIDGKDDYIVHDDVSDTLVYDDGDGIMDFDLKRVVGLKEKTYTSPNGNLENQYNMFVYSVTVQIRDLTNLESVSGLVLGELTIPTDSLFLDDTVIVSKSILQNQLEVVSADPATVDQVEETVEEITTYKIVVEVFLPAIQYADGDLIQIQVSVKVPLYYPLEVADDGTTVTSGLVGIGEEAFPNRPVANAGDDKIVIAGAPVDLDGSSSTGVIASYTWTCDLTVLGIGETVTYIFNVAGTYDVTLTVVDMYGLTDTDTVVITVVSTTG